MAELKKNIGKRTLLFLTINAILGTGIFFLPALGAGYAGPASIISWIIFSALAILMSSYFAELVSMFPKAGGIYEYNKKAFGEFPSFIVGWLTWMVTNITISMLLVGSLYYLLPGLALYQYALLSAVIIVAFSFLNYKGVKESTRVLMFFGIISLSVIFSLVFPGFFHISAENYIPFAPYGLLPIFLAMFFVSETFFGWETTCFLAEEVKNARKNMPKILIYSTIIISITSILLVFVSLGAVNWSVFSAQQAPLEYLASVIYGSAIGRALGIIMFIPLLGTVAGWIVSSPRLLYAMSRDKVLPKRFSLLSKYHTPTNAIIFQMFASIIITMVGFGNYNMMLSMLLPLVIISYSSVLLSVIKLRVSRPEIKRYYSSPIPTIGPIVILVFYASMVVYWLLELETAVFLFTLDIILIFFGIPLYLIIKLQTDEKFVEKFFNKFPLWDCFFRIWYGKNEAAKVVAKLNLKKGDSIMDFGCGSGITTLAAARKVGSKGKVVAVDISKKQLERSSGKIERAKELSNIILIHGSGMPFRKGSFDAVTAVGVLSHIEKPEKEIKMLLGLLKKGGRFSFMEFGKTFGMPAPEFLKDLEKILKKSGRFCIRKEKRRMTEYWYIWGTRSNF